MESRSGLSRRRLLQLTGAGFAVSIAGCSGSGSDDGDGNGPSDDGDGNGPSDDGDGNGPSDDGDGEELSLTEYDEPTAMSLAGEGATAFRHWLLPGFTEQTGQGELICQFENFQAYPNGGNNALTQNRQVAAEIFGLEPEALSWSLGVGAENLRGPGWIHRGSFDQQEVGGFLADKEQYFYIGPLEGYEIYDSDGARAFAVGTDTIIEHPSYDAFVAAEQGERDRLVETDDDIRLALNVVPEGLRVAATRRSNVDDLRVTVTSYLAWEANSATDRIRALVFDNAESATLERARQIVSDGGLDPSNITTAEAAGRVLMYRYRP
jgi:hypothetical protein